MNMPLQWLSEIYQPAHLSYFAFGFGVAYLWHIGKAYYMRRKFCWSAKHLLVAACVLVLGWVVLSTYNYNQCIQEFNQTLRDRSVITDENDRLSRQQRTLMLLRDEAESLWIASLVNPPVDIAMLPTDDLRRQAYGIDITREYSEKSKELTKRIRAIEDRQIELDQERKQKPYPTPTCGD